MSVGAGYGLFFHFRKTPSHGRPIYEQWTTLITIFVFIGLCPNFVTNHQTTSTGSIYPQEDYIVNCSQLRMGQYLCSLRDIDPDTQQPRGCTKENIAKVKCTAVEGLRCLETGNRTFDKLIPCKWTNGYSFSTTLLLSIFFGTLGIDRFYLGHLGMGALKFCTLGFLFVGQLVDIILIATQHIRPKDGSNYIIGYFGPGVENIRGDNRTYIVPRNDWFMLRD